MKASVEADLSFDWRHGLAAFNGVQRRPTNVFQAGFKPEDVKLPLNNGFELRRQDAWKGHGRAAMFEPDLQKPRTREDGWVTEETRMAEDQS